MNGCSKTEWLKIKCHPASISHTSISTWLSNECDSGSHRAIITFYPDSRLYPTMRAVGHTGGEWKSAQETANTMKVDIRSISRFEGCITKTAFRAMKHQELTSRDAWIVRPSLNHPNPHPWVGRPSSQSTSMGSKVLSTQTRCMALVDRPRAIANLRSL